MYVYYKIKSDNTKNLYIIHTSLRKYILKNMHNSEQHEINSQNLVSEIGNWVTSKN